MANTPIKLLENLANYCAVKNKVISKNIANIGTTGYQREDVEFKDVFNQSVIGTIKTTEPEHIGTNQNPELSEKPYKIVLDSNKDDASGINNVNIDKEMAELADNTLMFKFASRKISDYYKNIQSVIKGGGAT